MPHAAFETDRAAPAIPVHCVDTESWPALAESLAPRERRFAEAQSFSPKPGKIVVLPDEDGGIGRVLACLDPSDPFAAGRLATALPAGTYRLDPAPARAELAALAFALGSYRFRGYKSAAGEDAPRARLVVPDGVAADAVANIADAVALGRDLVNTPANDLGPDGIAAAIVDLAARHNASVSVIEGEALLERGFPMIHAVGRAASRAPRLVDLVWGASDAPKVTLVGKGVAFDTGGLDIKPSSAMLLMKKDMGGAAAAIAAAAMIMAANLPVRLRVLVPAVENSISGDSFRPGDVLASRKGLTVEIGNTDAEGRLILADALALADEETPDLLIDFATLTGAARVALGPDLPAVMTDDEALAADLARLSEAVHDPVWRLPFWKPYDKLLDSKIADVNHISGGPHAGAITAGLFLRRFVSKAKSYAHVDLFAWNPSAKPGRPEGGEVQAGRLVHALVAERYGRG
ncbi:leucyl aminopeptidase family protein [Salinarimonas ramus]|uniref:Aminopeptidase n=1 Tax=Salinarimonas ramus TaxID=690164 RepID=A0A917Q5P5_9HYPH|nr:leucyl aminopeptidase family protein [Salinarimonas ramus]GGK25199.1 aminopeptidase [Salinarimonas ramus]